MTLAFAIIAAEVLFWVFLFGGLFMRYALGWKRAGLLLLASTPVIDLALIGMTYVDLYRGSDSSFFHGMSAFYVGFSIVLGPDIIAACDRKFAARFAGEPAPPRESATHAEQVTTWKKACLASIISLVLLAIAFFITGFGGSFWIIYWAIAIVFTVMAWWFVGPFRSRRTPMSGSAGGEKARAGE